MHKVTLASLAQGLYQLSLEEQGYSALEQYLARAGRRLEGNPDRAEVLNDLERSIGEKLNSLLVAGQRVVTTENVRTILTEIGNVDLDPGETAAPLRSSSTPRKRLYRIKDTQKISGICSGLSAYTDMDVTIIRIIFVLLAFFTGGLFIAVYVVAIFIIPVAKTPDDYAAAGNPPTLNR